MDEKDTASRKWQLTFNNPAEHGWTHDKIREVLRTFRTVAYWCMSDEIGAEGKTPHTHLFINLSPSKAYDQVAIRVPKGTRERWRALAEMEGKSLTAYIVSRVEGAYVHAEEIADPPPPETSSPAQKSPSTPSDP